MTSASRGRICGMALSGATSGVAVALAVDPLDALVPLDALWPIAASAV
jgi:hypothetical protein